MNWMSDLIVVIIAIVALVYSVRAWQLQKLTHAAVMDHLEKQPTNTPQTIDLGDEDVLMAMQEEARQT